MSNTFSASSARAKFISIGLLAPVVAVLLSVFLWAPVLAPVHWVVVKRLGVAPGLTVQGTIWILLLGLWARVPAMPGLLQGIVCVQGWIVIASSILGWLAFAAGVICGFNGL
jgi:hypothetical protein